MIKMRFVPTAVHYQATLILTLVAILCLLIFTIRLYREFRNADILLISSRCSTNECVENELGHPIKITRVGDTEEVAYNVPWFGDIDWVLKAHYRNGDLFKICYRGICAESE